MEYWSIILQILALFAFAYYFLHKRYSYWSQRGISGPPPTYFFGNLWNYLREGQVKVEKEWAAKYGHSGYGIYRGFTPVYTILNPELVKQVLVKDFSVFVNRSTGALKHEILSLTLFSAEDELWRRIRAITSPSFTSGKLKGMHALMDHSVDKLGVYFDKVIQTDGGKMNIKEVIMGFTIDVIASTSFGTETNANDDRSKQNPFLVNGIKLFDFNLVRVMTQLILPEKFNKLIGNTTRSDPKSVDFFIDLSKEIINQRRDQKNGSGKAKRNDLVQLMIDAFVYEDELKEGNYEKLTATADNDDTEETTSKQANGSIKRTLTENEIIAQCIIFFIAGFETTATTISNALYNLAVNPEIQEQLYNELEQALEGIEENSEQYFETVTNQIPYLEATIKETLRMCPPVPRLVRRVGIEGYKLGGVPLEKHMAVEIAAYAIHHSAEFYPEPERFNPDRFLPENKHLLVPYTYLPFGSGPRNCIGMRFAYQEIRLCLTKIIRHYKFTTTAETKIPMDFNKIGILSSKNIPLKVSARS